MRGKKGFGLVQAVGILFMVLLGAIFVLGSFLLANASPDKTTSASQDFSNQQAHIMLTGFLQYPLRDEELSEVLPRPVIIDLIYYYGVDERFIEEYTHILDGLFGNWETTKKWFFFERRFSSTYASLTIEGAEPIIIGEDPFDTEKMGMFRWTYEILRDRSIVPQEYSVCKGLVSQAKVQVPTLQGNKEVKLAYCEARI